MVLNLKVVILRGCLKPGFQSMQGLNAGRMQNKMARFAPYWKKYFMISSPSIRILNLRLNQNKINYVRINPNINNLQIHKLCKKMKNNNLQ